MSDPSAPALGIVEALPTTSGPPTTPANASGEFPKWLFWFGVIAVVCLFMYAIWFFTFRKVAITSTPAATIVTAPVSVTSTAPAPAAVVAAPAAVVVAAPAAVVVAAPTVNILPSQSQPPINYVFPGDPQSPTGWVFFTGGTYRVKDGDIPWGQGLRTPDGAATYNVLQGGTAWMQTTLVNSLIVGKQYQITGYAANRPIGIGFTCAGQLCNASFDISLTGLPQPLATITLTTFKFDPFGPVLFTATATSHSLTFHGRGGDVLLGGLAVTMK